MKINFKDYASALFGATIVTSIVVAVREYKKRKADAKYASEKINKLMTGIEERDEKIRALDNKLAAEKWFSDTYQWMLEEEWKGKGLDPDDFKIMLKRCEQTGEMVWGWASDEEKTEED